MHTQRRKGSSVVQIIVNNFANFLHSFANHNFLKMHLCICKTSPHDESPSTKHSPTKCSLTKRPLMKRLITKSSVTKRLLTKRSLTNHSLMSPCHKDCPGWNAQTVQLTYLLLLLIREGTFSERTFLKEGRLVKGRLVKGLCAPFCIDKNNI